MPDRGLRDYTEGLSVLYVEDDLVGRAIIEKMLEPLFPLRYGAVNGEEGLKLFEEHRPSIVVTDLMMPIMDGIEMLRKIRALDQKTPVVLMTASLEHVHMVEAINLGVSKFLAKPLMYDLVQRALLAVAREISLERMAREARRKEVELLRYRDRYHSRQEELARRKEQHIVRNTMEALFLPNPDGSGWAVDLAHRPKDIMSGDSFSVHHTDEGRLLVFLADAMGHGLSASVTSMLATSFFNHSVDGCTCASLCFDDLAQDAVRYAGRNLLEDEVFSCVMLELDPVREAVRVASCGMPPLHLVRNGAPERLRGNNPPLTAFTEQVRIQEVSLAGVSDLLLATDGLGDAPMTTGGAYCGRLPGDLLDSGAAQDLFERFQGCCNPDDDDDDVTLIRLMRSTELSATAGRTFSASGTLSGIAGLQRRVREHLEAAGACGDRLECLDLALGEALMNAFEHGCLRMGTDKRRLLLAGEYDDLIMAAQPRPGEEISVAVGLVERGARLQVWIDVRDPGPGMEEGQIVLKTSRTAPNGRGFALMKRSVDLLRRGPQGNRILLMQVLDREDV